LTRNVSISVDLFRHECCHTSIGHVRVVMGDLTNTLCNVPLKSSVIYLHKQHQLVREGWHGPALCDMNHFYFVLTNEKKADDEMFGRMY
jgi:hypothetical protein